MEGEGFPEDVGAAVDLARQDVVGEKVIDEGTVQPQRFQQGADFLFQAALPMDDGAKWLWDAQVLPQDEHVHLSGAKTTKCYSLGWFFCHPS